MAHRHNNRAWRIGVALVMAVTLLAAGIAAAKDPQARAQAIAAQLRCPVCQNESVADSPSELAAQMRTLIREKVAAGDTDQQIVDYFVSKYGEWILLEPPRRGLLWIVWLAPAVALLGGAVLALSYVFRTARASGR
ncbi:MAG TPA: cytochrome c-type biogenesis protein [bacterium]|nr:cytochrome c-type biogenesis protein [bacterium]